jgi:hypothetical protein
MLDSKEGATTAYVNLETTSTSSLLTFGGNGPTANAHLVSIATDWQCHPMYRQSGSADAVLWGPLSTNLTPLISTEQ